MISEIFNIIFLVVILLLKPAISISDPARGELWARSDGHENGQSMVSGRAVDDGGNYAAGNIHETGKDSDNTIIKNRQNLDDMQPPSPPTGLRIE
ncbi:MAG: hypothetical protein ACC630_03045 [Nitrospinota bacterium]